MYAATESDLQQEARRFVARLTSESTATVVCFSGPLGAGKTTFIREMLAELGVEEKVTSPTFVIERIYTPTKGAFKKVVHIDAYRLASAHELEVLGWNEVIGESEALVLIEWPEMVGSLIPQNAKRVTLQMQGDGRDIFYE